MYRLLHPTYNLINFKCLSFMMNTTTTCLHHCIAGKMCISPVLNKQWGETFQEVEFIFPNMFSPQKGVHVDQMFSALNGIK